MNGRTSFSASDSPRDLLYIIIIKPINLSMALYIPYSHVCYSPEMNLSRRRMLSRNKPKEPGWTWNWREPWEAVESEFNQRNLHVLGMWDQDDSCRYSRKGTNMGHSWLANVVCASNHIICDSSHSIAAYGAKFQGIIFQVNIKEIFITFSVGKL